jgi:hypothetical protein
MTAACVQHPDWTGDLHRNDHRTADVAEPVDQVVQNPQTHAGRMLRHLERPSRWPSGNQDDATDLLTATDDRQGRLPAGHRSGSPVARTAQPSTPRLLLSDDQEVLPCW